VLISADPNGRFEQLVPKITQLQSKNNFDFMIMLGNVCHSRASPYVKDVKDGIFRLPLPIYFIDNSLFAPILYLLRPTGEEIAPNFNFLGRKGVVQIKDLLIAFYCPDTGRNVTQPLKQDVE